MINIKNKHFKKSIKLLLIIISVFCIFNYRVQDVSTTSTISTTKIKITYAKSAIKETYTALKKEAIVPKISDNSSKDVSVNSADNKNHSVPESSSNQENIFLNNSITIPNVCTGSIITDGSTQEDVNKYDVCLMSEAGALFGQGKPILMGGHNTKSLKFLYRSEINNVIDIRYEKIDYQYQIVYSGECTNDGQRLYDVKTGINMLDYSLNQEILYIYTCYGDNNWLIIAKLV